jgi:outer membrane protein assembly factor BamE (lipoprotein component of BamABCDE complex)
MAAARLLPLAITAAAVAVVAGCAMAAGQVAIEKPASTALAAGLTPQAAQARLVPGQTTKAQVAAALGPATVVHFDSGYEVWVYQQKDARADREPDELVVLFAPDGVVKKTRVRMGGPPRRQR